MSRNEVEVFYRQCRERLLGARDAGGVWRGRLSSSALSSAVAAFALRRTGAAADIQAATRGEAWLIRTQLPDGSWGDTPVSQGNLSTTLLALACLRHGSSGTADASVLRAESWLQTRIGSLAPERIAAAVLTHYGEDRTFSVPILSLCAVAGLLGETPQCWQCIPQLPFELAVLPRAVFAAVGLPVVSYALPALIALGIVRFRCGPAPRLAWRGLLEAAALRRLRSIQPASGGYLEAAPLTGFVAMGLGAAGHGHLEVTHSALAFLRQGQRPDGSWPIDSDLATWVSTLSAESLAEDLPEDAREALVRWLVGQQFRTRHAYTGAAPGGWAWTDLAGGVPDADDTSGALLALRRYGGGVPQIRHAAEAGISWLLDLANADGGMPTFCRGWGRLPFDRSCADITGHALRAFVAWQADMPRPLRPRVRAALTAGLRYLQRSQRPDGAWLPLWFGNESASGHGNPVYGTARVLQAIADIHPAAQQGQPTWVTRAVAWLADAQHADGGWGGEPGVAPSAEETALAATALMRWPQGRPAAGRGVEWLLRHPERLEQAAPIGLYFASLWYSQGLYPLIFASQALRGWLALPAATERG